MCISATLFLKKPTRVNSVKDTPVINILRAQLLVRVTPPSRRAPAPYTPLALTSSRVAAFPLSRLFDSTEVVRKKIKIPLHVSPALSGGPKLVYDDGG